METWKQLGAILLLPITGTVVIPGVIPWLTGPDTLKLWQSGPSIRVGLPVLGGALVCLGFVLMVATIQLFMTVGKGTLAPWNPPQRLVVHGIYRYVRNPMISGVLFVLCFLTDAPLSEVVEHLNSLGVPILEGPVLRTGAVGPLWSVYFRDADANLIDVSVCERVVGDQAKEVQAG